VVAPVGPDKIVLKSGEKHSFFAYLNSKSEDWGKIEYRHFDLSNIFEQELDKRYYRIRGVYDTTGYSKITPYQDTPEILLYSKDIYIEVIPETAELLQLTIKSDKQVYEADEKITIEYEVKNIGKDKILMLERFIPGGSLSFEIDKAVGPDSIGCFGCVLDGLKVTNFFLAPGESLKEIYELGSDYMGRSQYWNEIYSSIGKHTIKLYLTVFKKTQNNEVESLTKLTSNTITIEVVEKKCSSDEDCLNIDCSKYDTPVKEGYKPFCIDEKCKCMCYGCE